MTFAPPKYASITLPADYFKQPVQPVQPVHLGFDSLWAREHFLDCAAAKQAAKQ